MKIPLITFTMRYTAKNGKTTSWQLIYRISLVDNFRLDRKMYRDFDSI